MCRRICLKKRGTVLRLKQRLFDVCKFTKTATVEKTSKVKSTMGDKHIK